MLPVCSNICVRRNADPAGQEGAKDNSTPEVVHSTKGKYRWLTVYRRVGGDNLMVQASDVVQAHGVMSDLVYERRDVSSLRRTM